MAVSIREFGAPRRPARPYDVGVSPTRPARARAILAATLVATAFGATPGRAEEDPRPEAPPDTGVPGPLLTRGVRPTGLATRACSLSLPLCVHADAPALAREVLAAAERAFRGLVHVLDLPPPDASLETGAWDLFVVRGVLAPGEESATRLEWRDTRAAYDRAQGFTLVDASLRGCRLDAAVARGLADAIRLRVAPAIDEGSARAQTTYLASLLTPCRAAIAADAAHAFQSRPEECVADARVGARARDVETDGLSSPAARLFSEGASLFYARTEWAYARRPGSLLWSTWALVPTKTAPDAPRLHDEPDTFDLLRKSFEGALYSGSTIHDLMLDFGVARAFFGSADDGAHLPESATLGDAARVPLEWDVDWPATPRRYRQRTPVAPTGASYLRVSLRGAPKGARLRVETEWEEHALFRWAIVKVDAAGKEVGRLAIPTRERATDAQMTVVDLSGAEHVLLVGVNVGDPAYRFDPDDGVWEPHGWLVTIAAE